MLSVALLAFLYGYLTRGFGWFPDELLQQAWVQGTAVVAEVRSPDSVSARVYEPEEGGDRNGGRMRQPQVVSSGRPDWVEPRVYTRSGARTLEATALQPGLTLVTTTWKDSVWRPGVKLLDRGGRTVHQWRLDASGVFPASASRRGLGLDELDIHGSHLLDDGDLLVNLEYAGTVRLDACGGIEWRIPSGGHHSISPAGDGTYWIPGVTRRARRSSPGHPDGFPGMRGPVYQDQILRVSREGSILDTINVLDVVYENDLVRYLVRTNRLDEEDPVHLNDVDALPADLADEYPLFEAGDLAVSLRYPNLVFVVDPDTRRVKWHASEPFIHQHDPDFIGDGWIGVFDNNEDGTARGTLLGGNRIVALQPHTDSLRILFPTARSDRFYTSDRGKWQLLENGNMLLTEADAGRIVEVAPDGRTVWEWVVEPYDRRTVPYVARGARLDVTVAEARSWSCSTGESTE